MVRLTSLVVLVFLVSCEKIPERCYYYGKVKVVHGCGGEFLHCRVDLDTGKRINVDGLAAVGDKVYKGMYGTHVRGIWTEDRCNLWHYEKIEKR